MSKELKQLQDVMSAQHPIAGMMARVFEKRGGEQWLEQVSEEHPRWFLTMMFKLIPSVAPTQGMTGDLNITFNNNLVPTQLDAVTLDEQGRVVIDAIPK
jgi:hypothetical protein